MRFLLVALAVCAYAAAPSLEQLKSRFLEESAGGYGDVPLTIPDSALGQYSILSNGWPGQLTFTRDSYGGGISGTIQYYSAPLVVGATQLGVEKLQSITFSSRNGGLYVKFLRPGSTQWYFGLYDQSNDNINGHFESGGTVYSFDATRASAPRYNGDVDSALLGGSWSITSNGWPGSLSFQSATTGTVLYDDHQNPFGVSNPSTENLNQVVFHFLFNTWYVRFYRPNAAQWYWGMFEKGSNCIHGHFTSGAGLYEFDGTRAAALTGAPPCPVPAFFAGDWAILSNGWPGTMSLPGDVVSGKATITYDNSRLPGGTILGVEPLTALLPVRKYDGWYLTFYRPQANQYYFAVFDESTQSLHGHFTAGGGVYEFVAQKTPAPAPQSGGYY